MLPSFHTFYTNYFIFFTEFFCITENIRQKFFTNVKCRFFYLSYLEFVSDLWQVGVFSSLSTNKTYGHNIGEILLTVALDTITLTLILTRHM